MPMEAKVFKGLRVKAPATVAGILILLLAVMLDPLGLVLDAAVVRRRRPIAKPSRGDGCALCLAHARV